MSGSSPPLPASCPTLTTLPPLPPEITTAIFDTYANSVSPGSPLFTDLICLSRSVYNAHVRRLYGKVSLGKRNAEGFYRGFEKIRDAPRLDFNFATGLPAGSAVGEGHPLLIYPKYNLVRGISHLTLEDRVAIEHTAGAIWLYALWEERAHRGKGKGTPLGEFPMFLPSLSPSSPMWLIFPQSLMVEMLIHFNDEWETLLDNLSLGGFKKPSICVWSPTQPAVDDEEKAPFALVRMAKAMGGFTTLIHHNSWPDPLMPVSSPGADIHIIMNPDDWPGIYSEVAQVEDLTSFVTEECLWNEDSLE
ncbi:hypothetical protein IAT38_006297 [Cryptococcus sp. DSM 104549]